MVEFSLETDDVSLLYLALGMAVGSCLRADDDPKTWALAASVYDLGQKIIRQAQAHETATEKKTS